MFSRVCVILIIALTIATRSVHASIEVIGATDTQKQSIDILYKSFPNCCCIQEKITIRLLDNRSMNSYLKALEGSHFNDYRNDNIDGVYSKSESTITLRSECDPNKLITAFAHEYGHYVWFKLLTKSQREDFKTLYNNAYSKRKLVTRYAETSIEEGFADTFMTYILDNTKLRTCDGDCYNHMSQWFAHNME